MGQQHLPYRLTALPASNLQCPVAIGSNRIPVRAPLEQHLHNGSLILRNGVLARSTEPIHFNYSGRSAHHDFRHAAFRSTDSDRRASEEPRKTGCVRVASTPGYFYAWRRGTGLLHAAPHCGLMQCRLRISAAIEETSLRGYHLPYRVDIARCEPPGSKAARRPMQRQWARPAAV